MPIKESPHVFFWRAPDGYGRCCFKKIAIRGVIDDPRHGEKRTRAVELKDERLTGAIHGVLPDNTVLNVVHAVWRIFRPKDHLSFFVRKRRIFTEEVTNSTFLR